MQISVYTKTLRRFNEDNPLRIRALSTAEAERPVRSTRKAKGFGQFEAR
jgi:hypothetical protein